MPKRYGRGSDEEPKSLRCCELTQRTSLVVDLVVAHDRVNVNRTP